ncbi:BRD4-interacting chromatin-remodeling complex-associated protein-like isoform X4 [Penaeus japonicus]|uniref:BRD4-interacting chromatin-remodeling complex-associated protein-like isoform X4 n=1 Tax=Penaeus japonicus TaxID=27405 RepID=UPI001C70E6BE|nr:BRD4-interacting chromatin-remodeling complex-associated protein-like isoform X4 [Penaeus japonicus]
MGWTTKLFVLSLLGLATCQQRSISGGRRRQRVPAGKSEVANFNCPEDFGYYPHPTDCSQYYVCVFGGALQESCTGGLVYSHELQTCDWPRNVVCNLTQAGSGVSTVRITDPRTRTNPVRPVTEPLTSSVSSFDDRLDNSLRSSQSLRASNAFDSSDKANRQARFFQEKQEPKQQSINSQRFQNPFSDAAVQESNRRFVNTAPVFPSRKELEEEAWAWRDVSARKSHLFRRDLTVLDSTPDFDYRLGEPSFPSAATARFLQESPQHRLQESSPDAAAEASPRNSHSLPLEFRDQGITRRQSRPQGSFSNQGFPHNAFHTQQFSRFPPSNRPPPPNQFHLQSPANPFGNFQHFSPFGETFDTRPFANGQGRQPPSQQQILVQRPQADLSRPRPQGQFRPRPQVDPFRPRPQVDPFRPRPQADPFRPRPHGDPFRPPPETDAFLPRPLPGQFLHPESVVEPFVPEEAKPIAPSNPSQVPPHFVVPGQHPQHPFAPEVPLPPQRQPVFPPPPPESSQFLPRPPHDGHPQFPPPQPGPVFPPQPFDPESHRPFPTTPAPRITTFAPRHTTPAPRPTTFAPRHTTPAPRPTTLTPRHTKPQPVRTTPKPRPTTPAPRPTTPPPRPTSPATIATTPATRPTRRPTTPTSSPTRPARRPVKVTTPKTPFSRQRSTFPPFKKAVSVDSPQNVISLGKPPQIPGTARHPELSRLPASPSQTSDLLPPTPNQLPTHDDQQPSRPRQPTPAPRPVVAPQPTVTPSVDDAFYGDLNFTDADYFYYYDLYDVDYYDNAPTATPAPVRRPATAAPTREEGLVTSAVEFETRPPPRSTTTTTTSTTTTTTTTKPRPRTTTTTTTPAPTAGPKLRPIPERRRVAASSSKSFSRGGTARSGSSLPSSNSPTPSSSLRASSSSSRLTASSSRSQPLPSSSSSSSRDGLTQLFEFSDFDFDSARPGSSFSFSGVESPDPTPSKPARSDSSRQQSFRQSQPSRVEQTVSRTQSRSRSQPHSPPQPQPSSGSEARPHPARVQAAVPVKKPQSISRAPSNEQLSSQSLRTRAPLTSTLSRPSSPSSSSASSALRASESSSRGSSPTSASSSSSSSSQRSSQPSSPSSGIRSSSSPKSTQRSRRPSTSSSSSSSPSRGSSSSSSSSSASSGPVAVDNSVPKRPAPVRPQPPVDSKATRCDPKVCVLPDCYCGGKDIPGGFTPKETPQIVLLTFDDSVNDLNKELYTELFQNGRKNPNGCPITSTMYVSHEWTDYSQVQNLYADGHEMASHSIQHSFGEQFSIKKWAKEIAGQREIMAAYGGVKMEDVRGMRAPFLAIGGNKMFKMLYDYNFTYDSSMPVYENKPPSWPYTLDYKIFHDCMIPPCPTNSYPGVWQVPMVMWQDLTGGRCSMGDACTTPPDAEGVYKMLIKNFERHYTSNRAPFGLYYHAAWFTTPHHKEGFIAFLDTITAMDDVWLVTNWQLLQWMRDPQPLSTIKNFAPFGCNYPERKRCTSTKVCNVWHKGGVRYMRTCQQCPEKYPWTGNTGVNSPLNDL